MRCARVAGNNVLGDGGLKKMNEKERREWEEEDLREAQKEGHNALVRRAENQMSRSFLVREVCVCFMFEDGKC